ncbi:uncharacterized protein LOC114758641 [Neltuma alba]|uniref:uncharacterized protein LOC114758641 n=1 Tax=Neltuma alba TaxID=207710 RepID=UPI0010A50B29|nr:uncharacterized protein LOC114758641 [Prosopis alba]
MRQILEKIMKPFRKDWSERLEEALWVYKTAYKTPIGMSLFQLLYGKACHQPMEIEHKSYWAIKILRKQFHEDDKVLKFKARLKLMPRKFVTKWEGSFRVTKVYPFGTVELVDEETGIASQVNDHLLKHYHEEQRPP